MRKLVAAVAALVIAAPALAQRVEIDPQGDADRNFAVLRDTRWMPVVDIDDIGTRQSERLGVPYDNMILRGAFSVIDKPGANISFGISVSISRRNGRIVHVGEMKHQSKDERVGGDPVFLETTARLFKGDTIIVSTDGNPSTAAKARVTLILGF